MTLMIRSAEDFAAAFDVSRETLTAIEIHLDLLQKWNSRINLVSPRSLGDAWGRHIADAAQLWRLRPEARDLWLDLGSGGGFPGLVIAALAGAEGAVHLVEADERKAAFLATVIARTGLPVQLHVGRIDALDLPAADVLTARALAPLVRLLPMAKSLLRPTGVALFPKGETVHKEVAEALRLWSFEHRLHPSMTNPRAAIVEIGAVHGLA